MGKQSTIPEIVLGKGLNNRNKNLIKMRIWEAILYTLVIVLIIILVIIVTGGK
jgi:hypothetical protein